MGGIEKTLHDARANPANVRVADLRRLCETTSVRRARSGSHLVFRTPWPGDPRVNIQDRHGKAKPYQVKQVLAAIDRLETG
jgi:hypothetical protein